MSYFIDRIHRASQEARVAIYLRSATSEIKESVSSEAVIRQKEQIKARFPEINLTDVPTYSDVGVSGFTGQRPGLKSLCQDVEAGKYRYVFAADITRWSRNVVTVLELKEFALKHDCEFLSLPEIFRAVRS